MRQIAAVTLILAQICVSNSFADGPASSDDNDNTKSAVRASMSHNKSDFDDANQDERPSGSLESAKGERLATAIGHYARARSLLIEALREFDRGRQVASPDVVLNTTDWRDSVAERAHDLEVILDPQPRATRGGVKFGADTRLLNTKKR